MPESKEEAGEVSGGTSAAKKGEAAIAEKSKAASLQAEVAAPEGELKAATTVLAKGSKGAEVKDLQQKLNAWRKAQDPPLEPIEVSGEYDKATIAAVKKFEKAIDIQADGKAGPVVRNLLTLEGNPRFAQLDSDRKKEIQDLLGSDEVDANEVAEVMKVVTSEQYSKLDDYERSAVANRFLGSAAGHADAIIPQMEALAKLKGDKTFRELDAEVRERFAQVILQSGHHADLVEDYSRMAKDNTFAKLPIDVQKEAQAVAYTMAKKDQTTKGFTDLVTSEPYKKLSEKDQKEILAWIEKYPDARFVAELDGIWRSKKLAALEEKDYLKILDGLSIKR